MAMPQSRADVKLEGAGTGFTYPILRRTLIRDSGIVADYTLAGRLVRELEQ